MINFLRAVAATVLAALVGLMVGTLLGYIIEHPQTRCWSSRCNLPLREWIGSSSYSSDLWQMMGAAVAAGVYLLVRRRGKPA